MIILLYSSPFFFCFACLPNAFASISNTSQHVTIFLFLPWQAGARTNRYDLDTHQWQQVPYAHMSQLTTPFAVKVLGTSGLTQLCFPRLRHKRRKDTIIANGEGAVADKDEEEEDEEESEEEDETPADSPAYIAFKRANTTGGTKKGGGGHKKKKKGPKRRIVAVFVEMFLFYGTRVLSGFDRTDDEQVPCEDARFFQRLMSRRPNRDDAITIGTLPRETQIGFVLCGSTAPVATLRLNGKETCLKKSAVRAIGHVSMPLIDGGGNFATGTWHLGVWPRAQRVEAGEDTLGFVLRGPRTDNNQPFLPENGPAPPLCTLTVKLPSYTVPVVCLPTAVNIKDIRGKEQPADVYNPLLSAQTIVPDESVSRKNSAMSSAESEPMTRSLSKSINRFKKKRSSQAGKMYRIRGESEADRFRDLNWLGSQEGIQYVSALVKKDPLLPLQPDDCTLVYEARGMLLKLAHALPKFLQAVDWGKQEQRKEALRLLPLWDPPPTFCATLELLGPQYPDSAVREYAVKRLDRFSDEDVALFMPQLTECLKYEMSHRSALSNFMITRSHGNPLVVGHPMYWALRSMAHHLAPEVAERFTLLMEEYLSFNATHALHLRHQQTMMLALQDAAEAVVDMKGKKSTLTTPQVKHRYHERLKLINDVLLGDEGAIGSFQLALNPRVRLKQLIVEKCRYMSSKKIPLWLVFETESGEPPVYVIFKAGDDLRQDMLTLQTVRRMDTIWFQAGLDLRMQIYDCVATGVTEDGEGVGMIEVVMDAATKGQIQRDYGGRTGALNNRVLDDFLTAHNPTEKELTAARDNFVRSCAGWCVASFVLGLGDRHGDNIMLTKKGHLFHIDFGHFLGNFKSKFGVKRERESFVFTPAMA